MSEAIDRLNAALEGRYRVERELGQGGMAIVYLAQDLRHERNVALKVLRPELAAAIGAERFLSEIKTTAQLQHPHILPLHDSGEADGFLFYVMPNVEGESLKDRLKRERQLPVDDAVRIATDLAEALDYAHRQGVVHRDIKPGNVLLHDGQPMIADFGIALAVNAGGGERLTETGLSLGTPHYMSPEQATGDQHVGPATDIYALGCVLYEMLVGEPPYTGSTAQAILGKIVSGDLRPAGELRKSLPINVDAAIGKALEPVPADRFARASALVTALGDPSFAATSSASVRTQGGTTVGRRVGGVLWPAVALAALIIGFWPRSPAAPNLPVSRTQITLPGEARITLSGTASRPLDISPDGARFVYLGAHPGGRALFIRDFDDPEPRELEGTEGARHPFFSPDGQWVGFFAGGELRKAALAGGAPITITAQPPGATGGASWGDDGTILFGVDSVLYTVPHQGGEPAQLPIDLAALSGVALDETANASGEPRWPEHLPGGTHALLSYQAGSGVLEIATGEVHHLMEGTEPQYVPPGYLLYNAGQERLRAVRFDVAELEITGGEIPAFEGVFRGPGGGAAAFAVSETGTMVYIPGSFDRSLWILDHNGTETALGAGPRGYRWPRWSPDGRSVAAVVDPRPSQVWLVDVARPIAQPLTAGSDRHHVDPSWSPDGRLSIYTNSDLHWIALDGSTPPQLIAERPREQYQASWSIDGVVIVREAHPETATDLIAINTADGSQAVFLREVSNEGEPSFSPDGRWVAYTSDATGRPEIYVLPYPGPGPRTAVTADGGREPHWSRDGTEILYRRGTRIFAAEVTISETLSVGQTREVFDGAEYDFSQTNNWDVGPNGQLVLVKSDPLTLKKFEVVQNLPAYLAERFGN